MSFLLDGVVGEYPSWRNYFDVVITGASKPAFFTERRPFLEIDATTRENTVARRGEGARAVEGLPGREPPGARADDRHRRGEGALRRRPHLRRHPPQPEGVAVADVHGGPGAGGRDPLHRGARRGDRRGSARWSCSSPGWTTSSNVRKGILNALDRRLDRNGDGDGERAVLEEERRRAKSELERLRRALRTCTGIADVLERDVELGFNPFWGLMFKEGNENSRFGEQVEQYACLYTVAGVELPATTRRCSTSGRSGTGCRTSGRARRRGGCRRWGARGRRRAPGGDAAWSGGAPATRRRRPPGARG